MSDIYIRTVYIYKLTTYVKTFPFLFNDRPSPLPLQ